jgi:hypothetical protein
MKIKLFDTRTSSNDARNIECVPPFLENDEAQEPVIFSNIEIKSFGTCTSSISILTFSKIKKLENCGRS